MLEAALRRECCSLPSDWEEESVDEASWGFVAVLRRRAESLDENGLAEGDRVIFTAGGQVRTQPTEKQWGGVDRCTNGTGEISAILSAVTWAREWAAGGRVGACMICYDSDYVGSVV